MRTGVVGANEIVGGALMLIGLGLVLLGGCMDPNPCLSPKRWQRRDSMLTDVAGVALALIGIGLLMCFGRPQV